MPSTLESAYLNYQLWLFHIVAPVPSKEHHTAVRINPAQMPRQPQQQLLQLLQ
jgi:hypothetical protein